jgi:hypothetical protein
MMNRGLDENQSYDHDKITPYDHRWVPISHAPDGMRKKFPFVCEIPKNVP